MASINVDGHSIELSINRLSGKEHIRYDGEDVSSERDLGHATHEFTIDDGGTPVAYEVDTANQVTKAEITAVRRDGVTVYPAPA